MNSPVFRLRLVSLATLFAAVNDGYAADLIAPCEGFPDQRPALSGAMSKSMLGVAWAGSRAVSTRLAREARPEDPGAAIEEFLVFDDFSDAKDGMVLAVEPKHREARWEIFGSLFFHAGRSGEDRRRAEESVAERVSSTCDDMLERVACLSETTLSVESSLEVFGGSAGFEYRWNEPWSVGLALSASQGDLEMGSVGNGDIESLSVTPYLSYYSGDLLGTADFWAGLLYSVGRHNFDIRRNADGGIVRGDSDGTTQALELNMGLNLGEEDWVHGPYAGLRYLNGSMGAYTELGPDGSYIGGQKSDSLVSLFGYRAAWRIPTMGGFWLPQLRVGWEHGYDERSHEIAGEELDGDFAAVAAGIAYRWESGWNLGLEYEGRWGADERAHYGAVRGGKEF